MGLAIEPLLFPGVMYVLLLCVSPFPCPSPTAPFPQPCAAPRVSLNQPLPFFPVLTSSYYDAHLAPQSFTSAQGKAELSWLLVQPTAPGQVSWATWV